MSAPDEPEKRAPAHRTKRSRILAALRGGQSLNRFEAAAHYGDSVLNSTISDLRADGHHIFDEWESVPNRFGSITRVKRYRHARSAK